MGEKPDLEKLAGQYMDLWQKQLEGLAGDPDVAGMMARTLELMNAGPAAFATMPPLTAGAGGASDNHDGETPDSDSGPPPPAPAHGDPDPQLPDLARRLADLERRVAELEATAGGDSKHPSANPGKRRS